MTMTHTCVAFTVRKQMADVVEQGGNDQRIRRALRLGERSGLQRVLSLRNHVVEIRLTTVALKQMDDLFKDSHARGVAIRCYPFQRILAPRR